MNIKIKRRRPTVIDTEIETYNPILETDLDRFVAAAVDLDQFNLPSGPVISRDKALIIQSMIDDYEGFVDDVECLCQEHYGLIMTYQNESDDLSHYYNYLATDKDGNIVADIRLRLRISNHPPKRSKEQQFNKNSELNSEELHSLLNQSQIDKLKATTKIITVNNEIFSSYEEAFEVIDSIIGETVKKMKRNAKYKTVKASN